MTILVILAVVCLSSPLFAVATREPDHESKTVVVERDLGPSFAYLTHALTVILTDTHSQREIKEQEAVRPLRIVDRGTTNPHIGLRLVKRL